MKKTYLILGKWGYWSNAFRKVAEQESKENSSNKKDMSPKLDKIKLNINGEDWMGISLKQFAWMMNTDVEYFNSDIMLDACNEIKKRTGIFVIQEVDDGVK